MKKLYILLILLSVITQSKSQILLDTPYSGAQTYDIAAPEYVRMLPGFEYTPLTPNYFRAYIDPNAPLVLPIEYLENPIDPEYRDFNTTNYKVGSTAGQASVSLTGGATYTIPIFTPPGTAGMQPSVSLVYNSQGGNGIAGYGWNIAGLSAITRIGHTIYHEEAVKGVDFNDDRFALDGQRLIKILNTATYGADGTTYYTEVFDGSKIISHDVTGQGPQWFEVVGKDGSIMEYGKTDNARLTSQRTDQTTITWYISKITDPNGNYIQFLYDKKPLEINIKEIKYTGNTGTTPAITPYNFIKFYYRERTDVATAFIAGSRLEQTVLLDHIDVVAENQISKVYKLKHYFDFYSKLNEVEEYGLNNERYNSLVFGYGKSETPTTLKSLNTPSGSEAIYRDFDGDGLTDIYTVGIPTGSDLVWSVHLNKGNGLFYYATDWTGNLNDNRNYQSTPCDINGDGLSDILLNSKWNDFLTNDPHFSLQLLLNTGSGFTNFDILNEDDVFWPGSDDISASIRIMDINGDNKDEFILDVKESFNGKWIEDIYIYQLEINNSTINKTRLIWFVYNSNQPSVNKIIPLDINGDQKDELMIITDDNNTELLSFNKYGSSYIAHQIYSDGFPSTFHEVFPGDYNGDGKTDLLTRVSDSQNQKHWYLSFWVEGSFIENEVVGILPPDTEDFDIADYNNDGKTDVLAYLNEDGGTSVKLSTKIYLSFQNSFVPQTPFLIGYVSGFNWLTRGQYFQTTDFNGDGINDVGLSLASNIHLILNTPWENTKVLEMIADGLNTKTKFQYTTLSNKLIYNRNELLTYPLYTVSYPLPVVQTTSTEDGLTGYISNSYKYANGIIHMQGKGFLGFKEIETTSSIFPIHSISKSEINPTYYFMSPVEAASYKYDDQMQIVNISDVIYSNQVKTGFESTNKVFLPWQESTTANDFTTGIKKKTEITTDNYGNPLSSKTFYYENVSSVTETAFNLTEYQNYWSANGCIPSKPQDVISTVKRNGLPEIVTKKHFDYTADNTGNLWKSTDFYTQDSAVVTEYVNYIAGLPESTIVSIKNRTTPYTITTTNTYDSKYRYVLRSANDESFTSSATYDVFGNKKTITNTNELTVNNEYGGFGMPIKQTDHFGVWAKTELKWYTGTTKPDVLFYSESTSNSGLTSAKYFDKLSREIYTTNTDPNGLVSCTHTEYNAKGQVISISEPYFEGTSPTQFTTTTYHLQYGFPLTTTLPTGVVISYVNPTPETPGKSSSATNSVTSITTSKTVDATGKVISATDPGGTIYYAYFSDGQAREIIAPDGSKIEMTYDAYGRQQSLIDPDAGTISYTYNALGELQKQVDANDNSFEMLYDKQGRLLEKNSTITGETSTLKNVYYPATAPKGRRGALDYTEYIDEDLKTSSYTYLYDENGQVLQKKVKTDRTFSYFYTYNSDGSLNEYTYPSGYTIMNEYDPNNGTLKKVIDKLSGNSIYTPGSYNARGQMNHYGIANGNLYTSTTYDPYGLPTFVKTGNYYPGASGIQNLETQFNPQTGNLNYRKDKNIQINGTDLTENFTYDPIHKNRLATWQVTGQQQYTMTYADNNGNILTKSDFTSPANPYNYIDFTGAKPHAVKSVTDPLQLPAEALQTISYNNFNKVSEILHTNQGLRLVISYGPDEQRVKSEFYINSVLNKAKYFVGGDYEVEVMPDGSERHLHYLPGGGLYVSEKNENKIGMYYILTDYQGNWYKVIDETGATVDHYNFDAWGKRRNATDWCYSEVSPLFHFDRGYTGHEMLDAFGLINMNGRVYDPVIARFLSPDNYVQSPTSTQGFNRYSYCLNNPLKYTDPSGEFIQYIIGAVIGGFSGYMMADAYGYKGWDKFWYTLGGAAIGAATAGIGTAVSSSAGVVAGGVVGGAAGGAGFGTMGGYAGGLRGGDLFNAGFNGMWQGAVTGLAGSFVGGAIGGGWGAFAGGATAGGLGTWMSGGSDEDILKGAALGGVMGLGVYHASLAYSYHSSGIKSTGLNYNQYAKMMATTQRSMFWNREGKFIPNSEGGFNVNALGDRNNTVPSNVPGDYENALFDYHTHQEFGYDRFSNIQDAIAAVVDPAGTDVTLRQALSISANRGKIDPMTMYLGTREGNIHYWSHYGAQGTLNYNFSHVFTPYNLFWSLSLIR